MSKPKSKRELNRAIWRMSSTEADYLDNCSAIANAVVGQMLDGGVLKGGSSLKMRFGNAHTRATTDLDAARSGEADAFAEEFEKRLARGWEGFTGRLIEKAKAHPRGVPGAYVMQPYEVRLSYLGRSWFAVAFELGHNEIGDADQADMVVPEDAAAMLSAMGFPGLSPIALMPLHYQIAQKLHGVSEPGSQRAHDLVDLQLMVSNADVDRGLVRSTCERLFSYRRMQQWPPIIRENAGWDSLYAEAAEGLDVLGDVRGAIDWANDLVAEIAKA